MTTSIRIWAYLARRHVAGIAIGFAVISALVLAGNFVEFWRRAVARDIGDLGLVGGMALLHFPFLIEHFLPAIVLIGAMLSYRHLGRHGELVAVRATGISWMHLVMPGIAIAAVIGAGWLFVGNPVSAATQTRLDSLEASHFGRDTGRLTLLGSGFWIRETGPAGETIVHARTIDLATMRLADVVVFRFGQGDHLDEWINADSALLDGRGNWQLRDGVVVDREREVERVKTYSIASTLDRHAINEGFTPAGMIPLWKLPQYVATLEQFGFSARVHAMQFHTLLSLPATLISMMLLGAAFMVPSLGRSAPWLRYSGTLLGGVLFYAVRDFCRSYGETTDVPVALAAWLPALLPAVFGVAAILHHEDG